MASADPPSLLNRDAVASLFDLPLRKVTWWAWGAPDDKRYQQFEIARRGGARPRSIQAPVRPLKEIQRRLAQVLTDCYRPPPNVHGFTRGRSPATNASLHPRQQWVLRIDLEDFFPTINFFRVRGMFEAFPFDYPREVAALLAQLCCHQNRLPQGAPTSPIVSNYICRGLDRQLGRIAAGERCYFTRYADDLSFSTDRRTFPSTLGYVEGNETVIGDEIAVAIESDHDFVINEKKTRLMHCTQRQRVTGLIVNEKVNIPRNYSREIRNLLYIWRRHGEDDARKALIRHLPPDNWPPGKRLPALGEILRGRVQYVGSIKGWTDPTYLKLATKLSEVDETFVLPKQTETTVQRSVRLFVEGPTDVIHFKAALKALKGSPALSGITFSIDDKSYFEGDGGLDKASKGAARFPQDPPCLFIFDADSRKMLRQVVGRRPWKDLKNGVATAALAPPGWDDSGERFCIEMLYDESTLRAHDAEGRRLYLLTEFDPKTGQHLTDDCYTPEPKRGALVRESVYQFGTKQTIALSKMKFAEEVRRGKGEFAHVSFDGFIPTFVRIREALDSMVLPPPAAERGSR